MMSICVLTLDFEAARRSATDVDFRQARNDGSAGH